MLDNNRVVGWLVHLTRCPCVFDTCLLLVDNVFYCFATLLIISGVISSTQLVDYSVSSIVVLCCP